eukprot:gene28535-34445_t
MAGGNRGFLSSLLFGTFALLGLGSLMYYFFFRPTSSVPLLKDTPNPSKPHAADKHQSKDKKDAAPKEQVVVEDAAESDEEEEQEAKPAKHAKETTANNKAPSASEAADALEQETKENYDTAVRLSTKLIKGEKHQEAAEKLTEALALAPGVPSASKDISTLYNNRSAMFEKLGRFEEALRDITVLLTMDCNHAKARVRRARILEQQGKLKGALQDLFYVAFLERLANNNPQPSVNGQIESVGKKLSLQTAQQIVQDKQLPTAAFVRNCLDTYTTFPLWRLVCEDPSQQSLEAEESALHKVRELLLRAQHKEAFALLVPLLQTVKDNEQSLDRLVAAQIYDLGGLYHHLLGSFKQAAAHYERALALLAEGEEDAQLLLRLRLANLQAEKGQVAEALRQCDALLEQFAYKPEDQEQASAAKEYTASARWLSSFPLRIVSRCYALYHRAFLHIQRDASGTYGDADTARAAIFSQPRMSLGLVAGAAPLLHLPDARHIHLQALLKQVHLHTHLQSQMGLPVEEAHTAMCRDWLQQAQAIDSNHESLVILQCSALAEEGSFDQAAQLLEDKAPAAKMDMATVYCVKASILASR